MKESYYLKKPLLFKASFGGSPMHVWWLRYLVLYLYAFDSTENLV